MLLTGGRVRRAELHWYEAHGVGRVNLKINPVPRLMATRKTQFVVCIRNMGCNDLQRRQLYQREVDAAAAEDGYARIIDDSGESYLYPETYFASVELSAAVERELRRSDDVTPRRTGSRRR